MSKSKCIKARRAQSKPTDKMVYNSLTGDRANDYISRIDKCDTDIKAISLILKGLIDKIKNDQEDREVLNVIIQRRNLVASLKLLL